MDNQMLFNDTYNGPRFTYGLQYRPLIQAQVPDGWIIWSDREHEDYQFGVTDYPFEIESEKAKSFEMILVKSAGFKGPG